MLSELFELQAKCKELEDLKKKFRKYLPEAHKLAKQYAENTGSYIERELGDVTQVKEDTVTFIHYGWESTYKEKFPLELFTNPDFIVGIIKKHEEKKEAEIKEWQEQQRREYQKLKQKFG